MERRYYKQRRQGTIGRLVNHWVDRLVGAASQGSFTEQEEQYSSHKTKRDYLFNSVGIGVWGFVFPLLTIIVTQCVGVEQAGVFSLAFVTGSLLMILANYGVRTYQVSDLDEQHSFADYQINRVLTCIIMVVVGYAYCSIRGYASDMATISMGVYIYRMTDALADVYEGRLQQSDKMYLAGISQALRSAAVLIVFTIALFVTRNLGFACIVMAIVAVAGFVILTLPLAYMETPKSRHWEFKNVVDLFKECFPLFVALFLYSLIDNMPKFLMEGALSYDNQLYFNVLYFPAQGILLSAGLIYKPLLLRLAAAWDDPDDHRTFNIIMWSIFGAIVAITVIVLIIMAWIGIPVMNVLYGMDFEPFRVLMILMIIAGGVTAAIDFIYQVITVQRRQGTVVKLYLITFAFSVLSTLALVNSIGLMGAVIAYLAEMCLLFVMILLQFANIRIHSSKQPSTVEGVGQYWG
jgi:O-antigen/teichoic acid export membrane protein